MPGFNGRGPAGEGSMTGRGFGNCNTSGGISRSDGFYGRGRGGSAWGCGRGRGGFGRVGAFPQASVDDERRYLTDHLTALEGEVSDIRAKLEKLNTDKK